MMVLSPVFWLKSPPAFCPHSLLDRKAPTVFYWCLHIKGSGGASPVRSPTNQVSPALSPAPLD